MSSFGEGPHLIANGFKYATRSTETGEVGFNRIRIELTHDSERLRTFRIGVRTVTSRVSQSVLYIVPIPAFEIVQGGQGRHLKVLAEVLTQRVSVCDHPCLHACSHEHYLIVLTALRSLPSVPLSEVIPSLLNV